MSTHRSVALQTVPYPAQAVDISDDWTGLRDPRARRRIQSRLNQRASRRRRNPGKWTPLNSRLDDIARGHQVAERRSFVLPSQNALVAPAACHMRDVPARFTSFTLSTDHLIPLVHYNVCRAAFQIMLTLKLSDAFVHDDKRVTQLPLPVAVSPAFEPTQLQKKVEHAQWIDLFPVPEVRDTLILAEGSFDDHELRSDLIGIDKSMKVRVSEYPKIQWEDPKSTGEMKGMLVWSDPFRIDSWEVTEAFAIKWGWMIRKGCEVLLRATNSWRKVRGEEPLEWAKYGIECKE